MSKKEARDKALGKGKVKAKKKKIIINNLVYFVVFTFCINSATVHLAEWSHSTNDCIIGVPRATGYDTAGYKFLICGWSPALYNLK